MIYRIAIHCYGINFAVELSFYIRKHERVFSQLDIFILQQRVTQKLSSPNRLLSEFTEMDKYIRMHNLDRICVTYKAECSITNRL